MRVCRTVEEYRAACDELRAGGARVAVVPTMGALHSAHAELMRVAREAGDALAVTLFVNPTQFGPGEDLDRYPRTWQADRELCEGIGARVLFAPPVQEMYPKGEATRVKVARLTESLCGAHRPGHFEGVATVVAKLLIATGPCRAVFGRKDFQQLQSIRRMVRDLLLPVEIVGVPIQREGDGLAISSRNRYLSAKQRVVASRIPQALRRAHRAYADGERSPGRLAARARETLDGDGIEIEYADVAYCDDLSLATGNTMSRQAGLFLAVRVGATRLIDNLVFGEDTWPDELRAEAPSSEGQ